MDLDALLTEAKAQPRDGSRAIEIDARGVLDELAAKGISPGMKLNTVQSREVAVAYLRAAGWTQDRWKNWKHPTAENRRIQLPEKDYYTGKLRGRTFKIQGKYGGRWSTVDSYPLISWATGRLQRFAKAGGTEEQRQAAEAGIAAHREVRRKAVSAKVRKAAKAEAEERAYEGAWAEATEAGVLPRFMQGDAALRPELEAIMRRHLAGVDAEAKRLTEQHTPRQGFGQWDHGSVWSLDQPPYPWLMGPNEYDWNDGQYTVSVTHRPKDRQTEWMIGSTGGVMGFDPRRFGIRFQVSGLKRTGPGFAAGVILHDTPPTQPPLVVLTMIGAHSKKQGVGRKLMQMVRRLAQGYGRDKIRIDAITPQGRSFFDHLVATGQLVQGAPTQTGGHFTFGEATPPVKPRFSLGDLLAEAKAVKKGSAIREDVLYRRVPDPEATWAAGAGTFWAQRPEVALDHGRGAWMLTTPRPVERVLDLQREDDLIDELARLGLARQQAEDLVWDNDWMGDAEALAALAPHYGWVRKPIADTSQVEWVRVDGGPLPMRVTGSAAFG
jgi:hypothetical protein